MLNRLLIYGLLTSVIQSLLYLMTLGIIWFVATLFHYPDFIAIFGLIVSAIVFACILAIQNILTALINKKWFTWTMFWLVTIVYLFVWGEDIFAWPMQTILFFLAGVGTLAIKSKIDSQFEKRGYLK